MLSFLYVLVSPIMSGKPFFYLRPVVSLVISRKQDLIIIIVLLNVYILWFHSTLFTVLQKMQEMNGHIFYNMQRPR